MITAVHTLIYAEDPVAARAFFRDVLSLPCVDDGEGWLIFKLPPGELGVHPTEGTGTATDTCRLSLVCDDIESTVSELVERGAVIDAPAVDRGFGIVTTITVPGGVTIDLYEPRHATAFDLK